MLAIFDLTAAHETVFWAAFAAVVSLTITFRMLGMTSHRTGETMNERDEDSDEMNERESIPVEFEVECDEFRVPEWPGLVVGATYEVFGYVKPANDGDSVTPDGAPEVNVGLGEVKSYDIKLDPEGLTEEIPEWLQERLANHNASEMDAAFLAAIGGQEKLDELAIEKANQ